jgi:hypothetical protein
MKNPLVDWFLRFRDRRAAIKMAVTYFEKTKMLKAHSRISKVIAEEDGGSISSAASPTTIALASTTSQSANTRIS